MGCAGFLLGPGVGPWSAGSVEDWPWDRTAWDIACLMNRFAATLSIAILSVSETGNRFRSFAGVSGRLSGGERTLFSLLFFDSGNFLDVSSYALLRSVCV